MAITAAVQHYIKFSDDQQSDFVFGSGALADSPAISELVSLVDGNNTLLVPSIDDFVVHGVAIVPPQANIVELTVKGIAGDTGIALNASRPSVLNFGDTPPASIVMFIVGEIDGLRLVWF